MSNKYSSVTSLPNASAHKSFISSMPCAAPVISESDLSDLTPAEREQILSVMRAAENEESNLNLRLPKQMQIAPVSGISSLPSQQSSSVTSLKGLDNYFIPV